MYMEYSSRINRQRKCVAMCCESRSNGKNKYSKHSESIIKPAAAGTVTSLLMRLHFKAMELTDTAHHLTTALDSLI